MSQQSKFRKVAIDNSDIMGILSKIPLDGLSSETPSETPSETSKDKSSKNSSENSSENPLKEIWNNILTQGFDENELKELMPYLVAIFKPQNQFRYSPDAFKNVLEKDRNTGYNGTSHTQGAFQKTDPNILKQVEKFKNKPPKNLKDLRTDKPVKIQNINVPNTSDRYKSMRSKLDGKSAENSESKFVKTAAKIGVDDFKKLLPSWDISNVLTSMKSEADKTNLSPAEKQQNMMNILSEYEKSIAPLSQYLKKNDIKYK